LPYRILHKQLKDNFGRVCTLALFLLLTFTLANSQTTSPTDGSTPLGLSPGSPSGSHALSGFESVNPYNGNLNVHLPLISIGGRGGAGTGSVLAIDSKGWTVRHEETTDLQGNPVDVYTPVQNPWGPKAGYGPGVLVARQSGMNPSLSCGITTKIYQQTLTRLTFTTSDGTEYEFRDQALGGAPATVSNPCASTGANRGTVFTTADGTAATFISDAVVYDKLNSTGSSLLFLTGYLMLRDGTRYRIVSGGVSWIRDRNGNKLSFSSSGTVTTITDSLNRQVTIAPADFVNTFSDQITVKGFGGATRTLLVNYTQLTNALRTTNPRNEPASRYQIQTYHGLFPELNNASSYSTWNPWVVASVTLPNNQQYQFFYNCFAEVARINLPTSGAIEYDYTAGSGAVTDYTDYHIYRRVKERRIYPDGSNLESYTTYSESGSPVSVDRFSASGTLLGREKHYYNGDPVSSLFNATGISYPNRLEGREYQSEAYSADGTTLLRRSQTTWVNRAPVSWWWNPGDASEPPNDPRVTETTSTLADVTPNLVSKQTFGYDDSLPYNNRNDVKEFGFGNGSPGALVRETITSFITSGTYTGTSVHLRSLLSQVSVYDASVVERARTTYEYDNYTADANHAALVSRANISGFDSTFTSSYTTRGNATATTSYLMTNGSVTSSVSGYAQYDIAGNVVKAIDALGHATTFDFSDRFGAPDGDARANAGSSELNSAGQNSYAQATSVSNTLGQTSYVQFDYYLGRPVDAEDANGTIYTGYCNDVLDRPTQIVSAINYPSLKSQSTFSYNDTSRTVTVTRDQNAYGDNLLKGKTFYDGLGRTTEARTYENGSDYIAIQQVPFALQQDPDTSAWVAATQSSNPYRPYLSEQAVWTTTFTDALGRATKVRTPDSAIARTSYSGNTVTVSDQTGKARKSVSDALGRLTQVNEDPNGVNWATTYAYDVLNNLLTTSQGTQTRTFVYDSLKRLSSTTNPENGTVNFTYDNGGNLLVQTDARGVSTHLSYDVLNRGTRRWYNGSSSTTATTHNSPALPSGVGTSSEANFYYDAQTIPSAPTFARGSSTGRLVAVTYGGSGSSAGDYYGYDALGRDVLKIQQTGSTNYQTTATYSISGALTSEVYPSGRTVNYGYDGAGRTASFTGNLGDGVTRTYSTGIVYSSLGGMTKEQFGTDTAVYNKLFYDVRGQLSEIRESTSYTGPTDTTWNRGAIINHYSNNCWGMCGGSNSTTSMTDNNGNLKKQELYVPLNDQLQNGPYTTWWQRYDYDSLNRLQRVAEITGNAQTDSQQEYVYDRWGNRTIHQSNTWGTGIPKPNFGVDANTNRLSAPTGYTMSYDSVGNLTNDTYSGQGQRNYDAENRMTQAWANSQWQTYTYDGSGQRVRRNVNGVETWAVYGIGGELLAEYAATIPSVASPQKEYGYRNGQLLVTAEPVVRANVALAANGATATAQNYTQDGVYAGLHFQPTYANDGVRYTTANGDHYWRDEHGLSSWLQIDFNGAKNVDEVDVFTMRDDYATQADPGATQTFANYGVTAFNVQYWTGSAWATVAGGSVTGNNLVWKKISFTTVTTSKIRVVANAAVDGIARVAELEAWGTAAPTSATNAASTSNGGTATAQNYTQDGVYPGLHFQPSYANDGTRYITTNGDHYWRDEHGLSSWLQIDFNGSKTINEVDVYTIDTSLTQADPSATQTFTSQGATAYDVQYWTGSALGDGAGRSDYRQQSGMEEDHLRVHHYCEDHGGSECGV
jgi:YD repeat-containing protein